MKPIIFAVLTAVFWSAGSFFEKRGLHLAGLSPLMGITIRTGIAIIVLGAVSSPQWHTLSNAGPKPLLYLILGGGVLGGLLGMLCFYTAIGGGQLSRVMPLAFGLTPLFGFLVGVVFLQEPADFHKILGVMLICLGVVFVLAGK